MNPIILPSTMSIQERQTGLFSIGLSTSQGEGKFKLVKLSLKLTLGHILLLLWSYPGNCARGVMVTVVGNGHGDTSSIPGRD